MRLLASDEWALLRSLRLQALRESPEAFESSYSIEMEQGRSFWISKIASRAVAFLGNDPIGLIGWTQLSNDPTGFELNSMWVRPEARGTIAASRLVEFAIATLADRLATRLELGVVSDNARALSLYQRIGFVVSSQEIAHTGKSLTRMVLDIRRSGSDTDQRTPTSDSSE